MPFSPTLAILPSEYFKYTLVPGQDRSRIDVRSLLVVSASQAEFKGASIILYLVYYSQVYTLST